jgi:membrane-associated phospholipid phosphatase
VTKASMLISTASNTRGDPLDLFLQAVNGTVCALALLAFATELERASFYLVAHATVAVSLYALAKYNRAHVERSSLLHFAYHWLPAVLVLVLYFELSAIIPRVHPFAEHRFDRALQSIDVWLLGDPARVFAGLSTRWLSDVLTVCYAAYYPLIAMVPAKLYARDALDDFRVVSAIILVSFAIMYTGYIAVPAVGPHVLFDGPRAPVLDGYGLARRAYASLSALRTEPPDAFPSGHAMFGVLVPALAWRWCRPVFFWVLPIGVGIVLATVFLRFHYIVDVLAAFLLVPLTWRLGCALGSQR